MPAIQAMLQTHPDRPGQPDAVAHCVNACFTCQVACTACADACLVEPDVQKLVACIRLDLDCADVCAATASIATRFNKMGARQNLESMLTTCAAICRTCGEECDRHSQKHAHCRICAEACLLCAKACSELLESLRVAA